MLHTNSVERMPSHVVADMLREMIPMAHAEGRDHHVEALSEALDAIEWLPLRDAPRDGTWVLIAAASPRSGSAGIVTFARWVEPTPDLLASMGRRRRDRYDVSGGWWSSSRRGDKPFESRFVLAWRPAPIFFGGRR